MKLRGWWRLVCCPHTCGPEHIIFRTRTTVLAIRICTRCGKTNLHIYDPAPKRGMRQRRRHSQHR